MSIKRLLLLAVLVAIGACAMGPTGICTMDPNVDGTGGMTCTADLGTPLGGPSLPGDHPQTASVQR
jgi:hypothetical protein